MGLFGDKFSWGNILSGGITGINDDLLKATGMGNNTTLGAVNNALKHGPLETSLEQGKPASFGQLQKDRNERLAQDPSGNARTVADLAALVGLAYGGAAAAGGSGATAGTAGTTTAGTTGTAAGTTGAATGGGLMSYFKPVGEAAVTASAVKGLLAEPQHQYQPPQLGGGTQTLAQLYQQGMQMSPEDQSRMQRKSMWG